jgi:hypothetical protein
MNMDVAPKPEKKMFFKTDLTNVVIIGLPKKGSVASYYFPKVGKKIYWGNGCHPNVTR